MSNPLEIEIRKDGEEAHILLRGALMESSAFQAEVNPHCKSLLIDLHEVRRINSAGAQVWVAWTRSFFSGKKVRLERLPTHFVQLASIVRNVIPEGVDIESFYVPYSDESGDSAEDVLFTKGKQFSEKELALPAFIRSEISGQSLRIDVLPQKYFQFLKWRYPGFMIAG